MNNDTTACFYALGLAAMVLGEIFMCGTIQSDWWWYPALASCTLGFLSAFAAITADILIS
jgi:hypothetical protein